MANAKPPSSGQYRRNWRGPKGGGPTRVIERRLVSKACWRAKRSGVPFDLTTDDIVVPTVCPVLGIPIAPSKRHGSRDSSPSLDRIKPELGYVRGNVAVISQKANRIKNDASSAELFLVAKWVASMGV